MDRNRASAIGSLVFTVGLVLGLLGYVGNVYASSVATTLMLGVWLVGGAVARLFTDDSRGNEADREKEPAGHR
ncbi:MAG: hypothetical protein OEQ47_10675 [Acidimicrobiia bacterium]|nr:hypothetical protein [Acidimicrobiia bacterium]